MSIHELKDKPHWSYSALQCYLTCPMKYKFRYVDNATVERTCSALPFGRAFHAALTERARVGMDMSEAEVKEVFAELFKVETEAAENLRYKANETYDSLRQTGFDMLAVTLENWLDDYSVESVAESFLVTVPGLSRPLIGEFDCVVSDGSESTIVDWKTAGSKWPQGKADRDLQASAFCYAFKQVHGKNPVFRFDVITKTKQPSVNSHYTLRTEDELDRFVFVAKRIERAVNAELFYPNENIINCAECPYADRCKKATWKGASHGTVHV